MFSRVFYEAARDLDSQPSPRADHVEACRPRGGTAARVYRLRKAGPQRKATRSQATLRNLRRSGPGAFPLWVARPHTSVASLFAAWSRVWIQTSQDGHRLQPRRRGEQRMRSERRLRS